MADQEYVYRLRTPGGPKTIRSRRPLSDSEIRDLLPNILQRPPDISAAIPAAARATAGQVREDIPRGEGLSFLKPYALPTAAALLSAPLTAGMSLPATMAIEAGTQGAAETLNQILGVTPESPGAAALATLAPGIGRSAGALGQLAGRYGAHTIPARGAMQAERIRGLVPRLLNPPSEEAVDVAYRSAREAGRAIGPMEGSTGSLMSGNYPESMPRRVFVDRTWQRATPGTPERLSVESIPGATGTQSVTRVTPGTPPGIQTGGTSFTKPAPGDLGAFAERIRAFNAIDPDLRPSVPELMNLYQDLGAFYGAATGRERAIAGSMLGYVKENFQRLAATQLPEAEPIRQFLRATTMAKTGKTAAELTRFLEGRGIQTVGPDVERAKIGNVLQGLKNPSRRMEFTREMAEQIDPEIMGKLTGELRDIYRLSPTQAPHLLRQIVRRATMPIAAALGGVAMGAPEIGAAAGVGMLGAQFLGESLGPRPWMQNLVRKAWENPLLKHPLLAPVFSLGRVPLTTSLPEAPAEENDYLRRILGQP